MTISSFVKPFGLFKQLQANNRLFWKPISFPNLNLDFKIEPKSWNVLSRRWISVWCRDYTVDFGHVNVPANFVIWEFVIDPDLMSDNLVMGVEQCSMNMAVFELPPHYCHKSSNVVRQKLLLFWIYENISCYCFWRVARTLAINVFSQPLLYFSLDLVGSLCHTPERKKNSKHNSWVVNGWILPMSWWFLILCCFS